MRFLGMAGYCRRFCSNFATVAKLLTQLLSKKVQFIWNERCENAFEESYVTELTAPDFSSPLKLTVVASDVAVGAMLSQEDDEGVEHPVCFYYSKNRLQWA